MIVIYTRDNTIIRNDANFARSDLVHLHREKLGTEAYDAVKSNRIKEIRQLSCPGCDERAGN